MSGYMTWLTFIQIGIFVMGTGSLAGWIMLARQNARVRSEAQSED